MAQATECLPSKLEVLSSNPILKKREKINKRRKRKGRGRGEGEGEEGR
jgi:hypothetical protein